MNKFYGVAHGFKRGIYREWDEAKKQIDDFPQPIYKKFETQVEAEKFVNDRKPKTIELSFPEPIHEEYYTVARGNVVGIFTTYEDVLKNIVNYPQPLHKKFNTLDEAIAYFHKYWNGIYNREEKKKKNDEKWFYAVAKGHQTGVFNTWDECRQHTTGFKGAKFKKFDNEQDARLFAEGITLKQIEEARGETKRRRNGGGEVEKKKRKK